MKDETTKTQYTIKDILPSIFTTFIVLLIGCMGINALFHFIGEKMSMSESIINMGQWGITIAIIAYFMYCVVKAIRFVKKKEK